MSEVIISNEELEAAARKIQAAYWWGEEEDKPTLGQTTKALARWFERMIEDRLANPNEYVFAHYSPFDDCLNAVKETEALEWCKANGATIEKVAPPDNWEGRWTRITTKDGTSADGATLRFALQKLMGLLVKCHWCGNQSRIVQGDKETCGVCGRDWQGEAA